MSKLNLREFTGRGLDPIDDVRRRLEDRYTQSYFVPENGDWIADDYYRIIDLTTTPHCLTERQTQGLLNAITHLNMVSGFIADTLASSDFAGLLEAYNGVAEQVNVINAANPRHTVIPRLNSAALLSSPNE